MNREGNLMFLYYELKQGIQLHFHGVISECERTRYVHLCILGVTIYLFSVVIYTVLIRPPQQPITFY